MKEEKDSRTIYTFVTEASIWLLSGILKHSVEYELNGH